MEPEGYTDAVVMQLQKQVREEFPPETLAEIRGEERRWLGEAHVQKRKSLVPDMCEWLEIYGYFPPVIVHNILDFALLEPGDFFEVFFKDTSLMLSFSDAYDRDGIRPPSLPPTCTCIGDPYFWPVTIVSEPQPGVVRVHYLGYDSSFDDEKNVDLLRPKREPNVTRPEELSPGDAVEVRLWQKLSAGDTYCWISGIVQEIQECSSFSTKVDKVLVKLNGYSDSEFQTEIGDRFDASQYMREVLVRYDEIHKKVMESGKAIDVKPAATNNEP